MAEGYLRHFHACNTHDPGRFAPFYVGERQLGWVAKELVALLPQNIAGFTAHKNGIGFVPDIDDFTARSAALARAADWLMQRNGKRPRHEMYPMIETWGEEPLAQLDRAAVPYFGVRAFGIHVNGLVRKASGLYLWIGERAAAMLVEPGKLDNLIGGGQPIGLTLDENLRKEAREEADIPERLIRAATLVQTIRYRLERRDGVLPTLRNDTLFVYDLELPEDFTPHNTDGEVAAFHLMPLAEVAELVRATARFKFNCNLVITDFLLRHGFINQTDPEFGEIRKFLGDAA